jgi:hypothetical protein
MEEEVVHPMTNRHRERKGLGARYILHVTLLVTTSFN